MCWCKCRFRPKDVKELIHQVLMETLNEKQYSCEQAKTWSKEISDTIAARLKGAVSTATCVPFVALREPLSHTHAHLHIHHTNTHTHTHNTHTHTST